MADPVQTPEFYVICYPNSPGYNGVDAFLGPGGSVAYRLETANQYHDRIEAQVVAGGYPTIGSRGYEPAQVRPVYKVTKLQLGEPLPPPGTKVRTDGPHAGPLPKVAAILKGFLGGGGPTRFA